MTAIVHSRMPCNSKATVVMVLSMCGRVVVQEPVRAACPMKGSEITHRNASLDGFAAAFHTECIERNVRPAHAICVAGAYRDPRPPAVPITLEYAALVDV